MLFVLIVAAACAGIAILRGGSLKNLSETSFHQTWLLVVGAVISLVAGLWHPPWLGEAGGAVVTIVVFMSVMVFLVANRQLPGMGIATIGLALNTLVIVVNGAMPVSADAARIANARGSLDEPGLRHETMGPDTRLAWLADRIPVPGARIVLSAGDLVLAAGIGRLAYKRARSPGRVIGGTVAKQ